MREILILAGTRPEIIKIASLLSPDQMGFLGRLPNSPGSPQPTGPSLPIKPFFCYTGQHRELAKPFLDFFGLSPDAELDLLSPGQSLGSLTARAVDQVDRFLQKHQGRFSAALVQGDTTTAFAAGLTAFYHRIPVGHIEAGLRTPRLDEPFPEELNRRMITRLAHWHFAPTETARQNLLSEGISENRIDVTGNTGIDALNFALSRTPRPENPQLQSLNETQRVVLVTAHRRENIGEPLERICAAILTLQKRYPDVVWVWPLHRNPAVVNTVIKSLSGQPQILLTDPLEYRDLVWMLKRADLILSDSGGIQEEAPSVRKPVLVLREDTERPEAVAYGTSLIVGTQTDFIVKRASEFLDGSRRLSELGQVNPYGDGWAAQRIYKRLIRDLN